ncbi:uracil-DNA glycosylase-like protein [Lentinula aciculospora]|uniref:Uracil-DNA glycosylase n=1 Tax=Lentinula aciculospora TaxID=153920 RepID=A0A9W9DXA8_9AGAR|nr:uracil-DNA glycosylase-like protein [Lentinula aciculospora]KAJ4488557.1 uracil-DNA glycosylase-like protein [Lentinula aciculospora]
MPVAKVARRVKTTKTSRRLVSSVTNTALIIDKSASTLPVELHATVAAQLDTLEKETMCPSWYQALKGEFGKTYFSKLKAFLATELSTSTVYPRLEDVYSWSRLTPLDNVKVIILGQDPYHNVGQAHGLSFSVLPPTALPGSLKNIYKQIATDVPTFKVPTTGDLTPLARLGVLWLNTSLTVRAHKAGSHARKGWETLTAQAIKAVTSRSQSQGVVFMAWGLPAQKVCDKIGIDETKHLVLRSAHPSPLSAYRGFLGNGHFKLANEWLREEYGEGEEIDWAVIGR